MTASTSEPVARVPVAEARIAHGGIPVTMSALGAHETGLSAVVGWAHSLPAATSPLDHSREIASYNEV